MYSQLRMNDIKNMKPIEVDKVPMKDQVRFFKGEDLPKKYND